MPRQFLFKSHQINLSGVTDLKAPEFTCKGGRRSVDVGNRNQRDRIAGQDAALRAEVTEKARPRAGCRVEFKYERNVVTDSQSHPNLECQYSRTSRPSHEARVIGATFESASFTSLW
jgi:hypothetical protein